MKKIKYQNLLTEKSNPSSQGIDRLSIEEAVDLMNREDAGIAPAIRKESKNISKGIRLIVESLKSGGKIIFIGAGASGRLGVLESAELPPTFSTPPVLAQAIMAGGKRSVFKSKEGAEDDSTKARTEIRKRARRGDTVIGIAASGVTPFAQAGMTEAKRLGAKTIFVTCNLVHISKNCADVVIAPQVGPEIITGSTRLKSGTATKMVLNMLTTLSMVQMGKVYGNRMVDLAPRSHKLRERGIRLVQEFTGLSRPGAEKAFKDAKGEVKTAIVMRKMNLKFEQAKTLLKSSQGFLRLALNSSK
ncbi:MAG: N-acetylmuramic acid 6-phosphate etherase [Elusimicrobia bacterium RIFCSPLOWO2_01_FULL_54_10]|nr:MAG: N-acetylmuramic acid 6-phosphate etherase [Elusimicrobia bacterium RIFCSPLOWO2_01_FULL_54_10]